MSTILFTFSGTGNSLSVAETLAEKLGETTIVSLSKRTKEKDFSCDAKSVGFVFPLYFMGLPRIVAEFIGKVDLSKADYIFAVPVKGFSLSGGAIKETKRIVKKRGFRLNAGWSVVMTDNCLPMFSIPEDSKIEEINNKGLLQIDSIAQKIKSQKQEIKEGFLSFLHQSNHQKFLKRIESGEKNFAADQFCTGCGTCVSVCPVDNISLKNKHPEWDSRCEECFACVHNCPMKAVQFQKKPFKNKLYRNPQISLKKLIDLNG